MPKNVEIIFAGPNNGEYFDLISKISMKSYELPLNKIRISNIIELYKIIVREKIDIAHSNGKGAGFQTRILSLLFQNTQFVHVHHGIHFIGRSVKNMVSILLEKCFSRLTTQVFVSNSELKKGLKHKISGINYAVINNCIHKINDQKGALSENDLPSDYILCVSRFDPIKNIELLVNAFSKICIKFSNLKLLIIGDAVNKYEVEYYKKIMDLCNQLNLSENVIIKSKITNMMPYYKNARMLVSTSLGEGLPLSLIEGLYYETPIIASNVSGNKDVVNSKCAILHDNSLNELIYSIKFLLSNDSFDYRNKLVAIGKKKLNEQFSTNLFRRKYMELYNNLLFKGKL